MLACANGPQQYVRSAASVAACYKRHGRCASALYAQSGHASTTLTNPFMAFVVVGMLLHRSWLSPVHPHMTLNTQISAMLVYKSQGLHRSCSPIRM